MAVTLHTGMFPRNVSLELIDFGFIQRPGTGAQITRIDRPGSRWRAEIEMPPMTPQSARILENRLLRGQTETLWLRLPLMGLGAALGDPAVDGAGQTGQNLALRGFVPGVTIPEGYLFSIIDSAGIAHLHKAAWNAVADSTGRATVPIRPMLRRQFADGTQCLFTEPVIEGLVTSPPAISMPVNWRVQISFTLEETG